MKKTILWVFVFILLAAAVCSVQPKDAIIFTGTVGYELSAPVMPYFPVNETAHLFIYVSNKTTGHILSNEHIGCKGSIYDNNGNIKGTFTPDYTSGQFNFSTNDTTLNREGVYSYSVVCNSTYLGGFVFGYFEATESGREPQGNVTGINLGMGIALFLAIAVLIFMGIKFYEEENWTFFLSYPCWYLALLFPLYALKVLTSTDGINPEQLMLLNGLFTVYLIFYVILFIFLFTYFLHLVFTWAMVWNNTPSYKKKKLREDY